MKTLFANLKLQTKIILPIIVVSLIGTVVLYDFFYTAVFDAKIQEHVAEARALVVSAESAREYAADQSRLDIFKSGLKEKDQILHTVPVLAAMKVIERKADEMGVKFKAPKFNPRNPKNEPDAFEAEVLRKLESGSLTEYWEFNKSNEEIRYFRPVKLTKECESCHGDPAYSQAFWGNAEGKDPTGARMEGWKAGEVHGAFEIRTDLSHAIVAARSDAMSGAVIVLLVCLSIIGVAVIIARWISSPVKEFAEQSNSVAKGDLRFKHTPSLDRKMEDGDELGQLARSYSVMINSLRDIIRKVGESSAAVASASTQISASTEQMAAGAHEQTSQAGEVASAVEEMTKTIIENSQTARDTAETSKQAKLAAEQGGKVVEDTINGMKRIATVVRTSAQTVHALGKSSDQIGEIISVIEEIADQTNLLALNAAIEAARAGEQGRGFAVVADEVRKLAERTTKATKEIAAMIKQIQTDTQGAVAAMEQGTKQVDEGITLADRAGESLQEIVTVSQRVTDLITQIAAATEQQSKASELIAKNVEGISLVTQETANGAQQIAHTAEDLSKLTEHLESIVGGFQLSDSEDQVKKEKAAAKRAAHGAPRSRKAVSEHGHLVDNH